MLHLVPATTREGFAFAACLLWQLPEKPFVDRHLDPKAQDVSSQGTGAHLTFQSSAQWV